MCKCYPGRPPAAEPCARLLPPLSRRSRAQGNQSPETIIKSNLPFFSSTPHVIKYPADSRKITFWYRLDAISYFWSCKDNSKYSESPEDTFAQRLQRGKEGRIRYTLKCFVPFSLKIRACSNFCSASSWCSTLETVPILIQWNASGFRITCQLSLAFSNLTSVNS